MTVAYISWANVSVQLKFDWRREQLIIIHSHEASIFQRDCFTAICQSDFTAFNMRPKVRMSSDKSELIVKQQSIDSGEFLDPEPKILHPQCAVRYRAMSEGIFRFTGSPKAVRCHTSSGRSAVSVSLNRGGRLGSRAAEKAAPTRMPCRLCCIIVS